MVFSKKNKYESIFNSDLYRDHGLFGESPIDFGTKPDLKIKKKRHGKDSDTDCHQRYKFSFETDIDMKNAQEYCKQDLKEKLDFGNAFEFSGGDCSDNRKNYEKTYSSIFSYDRHVDDTDITPSFNFSETNGDQYSKHQNLDSNIKNKSFIKSLIFRIICGLSALTLIIFIPFIGWFFIKKLKDNQRAVVYRLGGRQKTKGPGFVIFLPVIDNFKIINTSVKSISIGPKPLSDSKSAIVECEKCEIKYKVYDPIHLVKNLQTKPKYFVESTSVPLLCKLVGKLNYENLIDSGSSALELAREMRYLLNVECANYGIQIVDIEIGTFKLLQVPPKSKESFLSKFNLVSPGLNSPLSELNGEILGSCAKTLTGENVNLPEETKTALDIFITSLISMGKSGQLDPSQSQTPPIGLFMNGHHTTSNGTTTTTSTKKVTFTDDAGGEEAVEYDPSSVYILLSSVIAKAKPLLNSEAARQALGKTTLELNLMEENGIDPIKLKCKGCDGEAIIHLDGLSGLAGFGRLPSGSKPTCSVSIMKEDLAASLAGRLDLIDIIANNRAKLHGDLIALSKLKFLIQLQPATKKFM